MNLKSKHKLNDENYIRLAILSRMMVIIIWNYGSALGSLASVLLILFYAILSNKLYLWIDMIVMSTPYVLTMITVSTYCCLFYIHVSYKFNLLFRRSVATLFVILAFLKIMNLYLAIYMKHILLKVLATNTFLIFYLWIWIKHYVFTTNQLS